jgi:hypothetical protein
MRFVAPLLFVLPLLVGCSDVFSEPPQVESDASDCVSLISCGCTAGTTYTCPSGEVVTCQDGGVWPESPCTAHDAGPDATTAGDAASDALDAATTDVVDGESDDGGDAAGDAPTD